MQQIFVLILMMAAVFAVCRATDLWFQKRFRGKKQHRSGKAVRTSKRYGIFGIALLLVGVLALINNGGDPVLLVGGIVVLLIGAALCVHYLGYAVFYDDDSFLVSTVQKAAREYRYEQIRSQRLYAITGGSTVIELSMDDGSTVSLQSTMDGVYPFLDEAFAGWCRQTGTDPETCAFHDPSVSWWFPHEDGV